MATIDIKTEMTGIVSKIETAAGSAIEEDDTIITIESMKMFIPIGAPSAGKITEILVAEGDTVSEGDVIARMEA